jgi:5-methylcytosine-specific restriction enzyme subunit McrC
VRRLFEKAVLGFARVELGPAGHEVRGDVPLHWRVDSASTGLKQILPRMVTDIVIDAPGGGPRLVIDTKLTAILGVNRFGQEGLRSEHLYQMYAYLRSQEGGACGAGGAVCDDGRWNTAAGLLLHPATGRSVREHVVLQGHPLSFATVDLCQRPTQIRKELRAILSPSFWLAGQCRR